MGLHPDCFENSQGKPTLTDGSTTAKDGYAIPNGYLKTTNKCYFKVQVPVANGGSPVDCSIDIVNMVNSLYFMMNGLSSSGITASSLTDAGVVLYSDPASEKLNDLIGKSNAVISGNLGNNNITSAQLTAAGGVSYSDGLSTPFINLLKNAGAVMYSDTASSELSSLVQAGGAVSYGDAASTKLTTLVKNGGAVTYLDHIYLYSDNPGTNYGSQGFISKVSSCGTGADAIPCPNARSSGYSVEDDYLAEPSVGDLLDNSVESGLVSAISSLYNFR